MEETFKVVFVQLTLKHTFVNIFTEATARFRANSMKRFFWKNTYTNTYYKLEAQVLHSEEIYDHMRN